MAPLTSTHGCDSCLRLTQKVSDLEGRISTLYQLRDEERLIDTLVTVGAPKTNSYTGMMDTTVPCADVATSQPAETTVPCTDVATSQPADHWSKMGAKPKFLASSTPSQDSRWTTASRGKHGGKLHHHSPPAQHLRLSNKFSILNEQDFPPLIDHHVSPPSVNPSSHLSPAPFMALPGGQRPPASCAGSIQFTPHPSYPPNKSKGKKYNFITSSDQQLQSPALVFSQLKPRHEQAARSSGKRASPRTVEKPKQAVLDNNRPTVLVMGTSMVRHVRISKCLTSCHPGALVNDINSSAQRLLRHHPSVSTVVVEAGTNDLRLQQSEKLKDDFLSLIDNLRQTNKQIIILGPLPSPHFGDVKFSRLWQLHTWLKGYCSSKNIPYVDNFTTFYNRPFFFKKICAVLCCLWVYYN